MRLSVQKTGLILFAITMVASTAQASALTPESLLALDPKTTTNTKILLDNSQSDQKKVQVEKIDSKVPAQVVIPVVHDVEPGESLTKVATSYQTTWTRLYDKNTQIENPNVIRVNEKIVIPNPEEQLATRVVPEPVQAVPAISTRVQAAKAASPQKQPVAIVGRASSAGNSYSAGYCTWYAKSRRPDMPNNLGNADTWVVRAAAQGMAIGSAPRAGAIGQRGMHVVYVEAVNGDGTITVSEMNFQGWNVVSSRSVPANYFQYIY